jgi:uncharacterized membrane protein
MSAFSKLVHGPPGHPVHPPLTDATIGMYTLAAILGVVGALGWMEDAAGKGMWLALVFGLGFAAVTVVTGVIDYLTITPGTPMKRTATLHALSNATGNVFFVIAAFVQYDGFRDGNVTTGGWILTLVGFAFLTIGGWLGGSITYVHGMRVLELPDEPTRSAITPGGKRKDEAAA